MMPRTKPQTIRRRIVASLLAAGLMGLSTFSGSAAPDEPTWLLPSLRDAQDRFTNPIGELLRGGIRVRLPFLLGRIKATLSRREGAPPSESSGTTHFKAALAGSPTVTWIGHATMLVEMDGVRFLTDPMWSKRASPLSWIGPARHVAPGMDFDDLPPINFVLISHNHFDHLDLPTLIRLAERDANTRFLVPLGNGELLRDHGISRVTELDWTEQTRIGEVEIHCLPSQHWSKRSLTDTNKVLWSSWAVIGKERRFYFAGDTGYFSGFSEIGKALGPFHLAAVPIGAYEPTELMRLTHMNPEEAYQAAFDVRAETAVAMHFGTFDLADEPLDEPPKRFLKAAAELDGPEASAPTPWVLSIGEMRRF
ncbi:MAG: MBL fold metallo-hydrolase [bacterium]